MKSNSPLVRLIYASKKDRYVDGTGLKEILAAAQDNNQAEGITGVLVFNSHFFLQALEGTRAQVTRLYNKITGDDRHHDVQLLRMGDITVRNWADWSMQLISITAKEERIYHKFTEQSKFNPFALSSEQSLFFLTEITSSTETLPQ